MSHIKAVPILSGDENGMTYFDSEDGVCTMSSRANDEYDRVWESVARHIDDSDLLRLYDKSLRDLALEIVNIGIDSDKGIQELLRQKLLSTSATIHEEHPFEVFEIWDELPSVWKVTEPSEDSMQLDLFTYFGVYLEGLVDGILSGSVGIA